MLMQRIAPQHSGQIVDDVAAVQHNFPKAAVHSVPNRQNPIRPFAAPVSDVSDADKACIYI